MADLQYARLFEETFESFMGKYKNNTFRFLDESAMRSALFFDCYDTMVARKIKPLIEYNASPFLGSSVKADLVLGDHEVAVEFKFEPRYPRLLGWKSKIPVVLWEEVGKDLAKIELYQKSGVPISHFIFIDEDGRFASSRSVEGGWKKVTLPDRDIHIAHVTRRAPML
jgi:hypothetical protein